MADLSIFKLDSQTITIKDTTARQTAESAKELATTAATAGNAVREQIIELKNEIDKIGAVVPMVARSNNKLNPNTMLDNTTLNGSGIATESTGKITSDFIETNGETSVVFARRNSSGTFSTSGYARICFYNAGRGFISSVTSGNPTDIPPNTAYIRIAIASNTNQLNYVGFSNTLPTNSTIDEYAEPEYLEVAGKADVDEKISELQTADPLYGKKWAMCGDSFTAGDFSGLNASDYIFADGKYAGKRKVYGYYIGNRHNMDIQNLAAGGRTMGLYNAENSFSVDGVYNSIDTDTDYITLYFGINDAHNGTGSNPRVPLGTINDNDNTTFYGAWNVVCQYLVTNFPFAHVGIIITNAADRIEYPNAEIEIAKKWGIPYLNINGDPTLPLFNRVTGRTDLSQTVLDAKNATWACVYGTNNHPNPRAHEFMSYVIEDWLKQI